MMSQIFRLFQTKKYREHSHFLINDKPRLGLKISTKNMKHIGSMNEGFLTDVLFSQNETAKNVN